MDNDQPTEATDESFGALLIEGLREVRAVALGEMEAARRVRRPMTAPSHGGRSPTRPGNTDNRK